MEYTIVIHPAEEGGYWTEVPLLPECYSQGETIEEVFRNIKEAIDTHVEALRRDGRDVPQEAGVLFGRIEVA
ncbi:MAG: type II toxin-antitoxin system HicB family antitoxin [Dehalococcoidia bacterium]|nr:type II toxin-antitoxin system HicB family antitoxin [Dehalococcoidia bacterium]